MAATTIAIESAARRLFAARRDRQPIPPVRRQLPAGDVAAAYAVQRRNVQRRLAAGHRVVGRKIGLTSEAVQRQLGVDRPDFGVLFDDMAYHGDHVTIPCAGFIAPRIEAEIAFVLGADLTASGLSRTALQAAISGVAASAEIVDSAIADWAIDIVDTVADNASSGAFALGSPQPYSPGMDLAARLMRMTRDGERISDGSGAATLGHPLNALAWLADTAIAVGQPLRQGDIILAGALGPMKPFAPADYRIEIDGFPPLTVRAAP
ncbi:MAG TPA: fumarylacetoacetate hydrolase family protein [Phenylobacterium sp.]|nr:fumarylacetoacetate hydrolase family protein [Phenylobacterium sp.]